MYVDQSSGMITTLTVAEVQLEAEGWKNGQHINTLTAGARDQEEGLDRSSEQITLTLEKTLQRTMQELIPDIVKNLENSSSSPAIAQ